MTTYDMYVRLLEELHHEHGDRRTSQTRSELQDVLINLRDISAIERGLTCQEIQDGAESEALNILRGLTYRRRSTE
jgi:hypothetical protein